MTDGLRDVCIRPCAETKWKRTLNYVFRCVKYSGKTKFSHPSLLVQVDSYVGDTKFSKFGRGQQVVLLGLAHLDHALWLNQMSLQYVMLQQKHCIRQFKGFLLLCNVLGVQDCTFVFSVKNTCILYWTRNDKVFKPGACPQPAKLWALTWFTEIVFVKVCVCVCVCTYLSIYLCLSIRTHVSKIVK